MILNEKSNNSNTIRWGKTQHSPNLPETEKYIIATDEGGAKRACKLNMSKTIGWDWEDLSGGVYNGVNYLFIGSFGDNDEQRTDYRIIYFEEPSIDPVNAPEQTVTPKYIKYVYPDGKSHNNEALMYDNVDQMIYIITKVYYSVTSSNLWHIIRDVYIFTQ